MEQQKYPFTVAVGIVKYNDKILMTKRCSKHHERNGKWQFPGGTHEFGETLEQALKRELLEEVAIHVNILGDPKVVEYMDDLFHGILFFYPCEPIDDKQTVLINEESSDFGWFSLEEAKKLDLLGANASILDEMVEAMS